MKMEYWIITAGHKNPNEYWKKFQDEKVAAYGWDDLGDLRKNRLRGCKTHQEMKKKIDELMKRGDFSTDNKPSKLATYFIYMRDQIGEGDIIIAKTGSGTKDKMNKIFGIGKVIKEYQFESGPNEYYRHRIGVDWIISFGEKPIEFKLPKNVPQGALSKYHHYDTLKKAILDWDSSMITKLNELENGHNTISNMSDDMLREGIIAPFLQKKQVILWGPPGTGKTFITKRIANEIFGGI